LAADITLILQEVSAGDHAKADQLFRLVYDDFRRLAQGYLRERGSPSELQPTEIVHEAYLRLVNQNDVSWKDRSHFFAVGARAMRQILVDEARKRMAQKRGGQAHSLSMGFVAKKLKVNPDSDVCVLAVDEAVEKLAKINSQRADFVVLRFFGGLTVDEAAEAIGMSRRTAMREWKVAKSWLRRELSAA
jgi:RNA polymerase sigma factor (TIGR02999 family)